MIFQFIVLKYKKEQSWVFHFFSFSSWNVISANNCLIRRPFLSVKCKSEALTTYCYEQYVVFSLLEQYFWSRFMTEF